MSQPSKGHNLQPFDPSEIVDLETLPARLRFTYQHLFTEQAALVAAAVKWITEHPNGVVDDDDQGAATEQVAQLKTVRDAYYGKDGSAHKLAKEPFLKAGRIVDAVMNAELVGPIDKAIADIVGPMQSYAQRKLREAQAAAAALAKMAAEEAASRHTGDPMRALQAEQDALDAAAVAAQPVGPQSQVRGDLGGMSSLRGKWVAKITNEDLIPRPYMQPNMDMINAKMTSSKDKSGKPTAVIAGVEWVLATKLAIHK